MANIDKYIGIPFLDCGRSMEGADCLGLILLFYRYELGIILPDDVTKYLSAHDTERIVEYLEEYVTYGEISEDVSELPREPYDMYVFKIGGYERHVGIHLPDGKMLHLMHGTHSCVEDPTTAAWKRRISRVFRYVECEKEDLPVVKDGLMITHKPWFTNKTTTSRVAHISKNTTLEMIVTEHIKELNKEGLYSDVEARELLAVCSVRVDGVLIPRDAWATFTPKMHSHIVVFQSVQGGGGGGGSKSIWKIIGGAILTVIGAVLSFTPLAFLGTPLISMGIGMMIGGVAELLFPTPTPELPSFSYDDSGQQSQAYAISGGQNSANPDGFMPIVLGRHKFTPPLASKSWTAYEGQTQYFQMIVQWGQQDLQLYDMKIEDTPVGDYNNVTPITKYSRGTDLEFFGNAPNETQVGATLSSSAGWVQRTVGVASEISVDIIFQQLFSIGETDGKVLETSVEVQVEYKNTDESSWSPLQDGAVWTFSNSDRKMCVFTLRRDNLPEAEYEVRMKRITPDTDSQYIQDVGVWQTMRAFRNYPVFNLDVPVMTTQLKIQASEQLSGYVSQLNAICQSVCLDWDYEKQEWVKRATRNPASLALYILTDPYCIPEPFTMEQIHLESFQEAHDFCRVNGYTFDFIVDTEKLVYDRVNQILAAGRCAVTLDYDGKWGVIIDTYREYTVQMFTPRNSWGMAESRGFGEIPRALRVSFINADKDYEQDEQYIYWDGYGDITSGLKVPMPSEIVPWEYTGVTSWNNLWKMGRRHLSKLMHRQVGATLNADWENLICKRGDLVGVSHDVIMNRFGGGYIKYLIYRADDGSELFVKKLSDIPASKSPIGLRLDDSVLFSMSASYGIEIRTKTGRSNVFELVPVYDNQEHWNLYFRNNLASMGIPYPELEDLCSVGLLDNVTEKYLFGGATYGERGVAQINLVPYKMDEIEAAVTGEIPPYNPTIILDTVASSSLPTPNIIAIKSDESVMLKTQGSLITRMAVYGNVKAYEKQDAIVTQAMAKKVLSEDAYEDAKYAQSNAGELSAIFDNVEEKAEYEVRIRLLNAVTGKTSEWSDPVRHTVVGKTTPPPNVQSFSASVENPVGVRLTWGAVDVPDLQDYVITGDASIVSKNTQELTADLVGKSGVLTYSIVARDVGGLMSTTPKAASVSVSSPSTPYPSHTIRTDGLWILWQDCKTTWDVKQYRIIDKYFNKTVNVYSEQLDVAPRPYGTYQFTLQAIDIFNNVSSIVTYSLTVPAIDAPVPVWEIKGGVLRIMWSEPDSAFPIKQYEVATTDGILVSTTASNFYDVPPDRENTAGVLELRFRAVDTAGNVSDWGLFSNVVSPPQAPVVNVKISDDKRNVVVSWNLPATQVPIAGYDVVAQYDKNGVTYETDYGFFDTNVAVVEALSVDVDNSTYRFFVRAKNYMEMTGAWGDASISIIAPSTVLFTKNFAIDNNMLLYWNPPARTSFAIKEYLIYKQDGTEDNDNLYYEEGRIDSQFFSSFETQQGSYTFRVFPVDWAGNIGEKNDIVIKMDTPPDFVLYHDYDSNFNGVKDGMVLVEGESAMIAGVVENETWQQNVDRIGAGTGLTWQQKVDRGYRYYTSPHVDESTYTEVVDIGTLIASTRITVTPTWKKLEGTAELRCKIEISLDGVNWEVATDNGLEVYATQFRYVCYTIRILNGLAEFSGINYKLSVKLKKDNGVVVYNASQGMQGVWVPFVTDFIDVQGVPLTTVNETTHANPLTAYVNFDDVISPTGFYVFVLDKNGNPHNGTVTWQANGV